MIANTTGGLAEELLYRFAVAQSTRGIWESHWEEIAHRVLPAYADSFFNKGLYYREGQKRTEQMVDATAALALPKFAAAMESMLTPRSQTWHRLTPLDKALMRNRAVREWFDDVNDILFRFRYAPNANYASQQHEIYMTLGAFGTGCLLVDPLERRFGGGMRYRAIHLAGIYFLENHQGIIDTAFRRFDLTGRQILQKFEPESLPKALQDIINDPKKQDERFWFLHVVKPRTEAEGYDPRRLDVKGMQYTCYYISETGRAMVTERGGETGYNSFPYSISRYVQAPGEVYGRSPAMTVLPDIKVLNEMKKTILKQGHRAVDPVLLAHDDGVMSTFNMRPGALNYGGVSADGKPLVHALPVGDLSLAKEMVEGQRAIINDAFLVTLFQILIDTPQMTATEVLERAREKGALLSPTMGRQQSEALGPMIHRELDILSYQRKLPPVPPMLQQAGGIEYQTVYESPLSRAQRAEGAAGLMRLTGWLQEIIGVTQDPAPLDNIDFDAAVPELAEMTALPTRWIRDEAAKAEIRKQRAQQQQMKQATEAGPSLAAVAKALPQLRSQGAPVAGS